MTQAATQPNANIVRPAVNAVLAADAALLAGFEKMLNFNMQVSKAMLQETSQAFLTHVIDNPGNPVRAFAIGFPKESQEHCAAYWRFVQTVGAEMQTALAQTLQVYVSETDQQLRNMVSGYSKQNAMFTPPGSQNVSLDVWLKAFNKIGEGMVTGTEGILKNMADAAGTSMKAMNHAAA